MIMNRICIGIIVLLLLVLAGGTYKFMLQGDDTEHADGRMVIHLNAEETDLVLTEMRLFLTSIQQITKGITEDDMELVAEYARLSGKVAQAEMPGPLVEKLPIPFKELGSDTHIKFDRLALDAEEFGDSHHALSQLSTLMQNCISCHANYRIQISNKQ